MKAFKNRKGNILTVFKTSNGKYTVYIRRITSDDYVRYTPNPYPLRDSKFEAETDLTVLVAVSPDKTWRPATI